MNMDHRRFVITWPLAGRQSGRELERDAYATRSSGNGLVANVVASRSLLAITVTFDRATISIPDRTDY